ncbi:zinc fingers and homeoboxes protein 3 isoform X2 [Antennarius striatus]|uniref:zinc fingers and homeoboxes protein 3 isoform X2 n=1 Tax=Antennarius striatus TaxID=241820 RepID=UPI0035B45FEE
MASKRKSTTPCMIPSKIIRPPEDAEQDYPVLLNQFRNSGGDRQSPSDPGESSNPEAREAVKDCGDTYTCKPCEFETHDLNLFLDHVYSGHPDFRADPSFFCVNCGVSAPKFEGLALHNARVHPSTLNTTLQLKKKERRAVVEQTLSPGVESSKESEIHITKTPIMRMLKGKSEPKRIVVSHPGSDDPSVPDPTYASVETEKKETAAVAVTHVPTIVHNGTAKVTLPSAIQIVNGSGTFPVLKTPITQVVSVVQSRSLHQSAPITTSTDISSTSSSSKNLPKVMIPLSSIPTYNAAMDSSSFLKTSFSKFPYPTKAELCYLTVVTKFPEEQIKIWFTAQRLKQGISWSPEEIEEARRKMFNTIIQTAPSSAQKQTQSHRAQAQHTITVLPASLGSAGIPHILQGSLVSQGGVIVTQPVMTNGIQVSSAPVALAVAPKAQAAARPMMQARPAAALVADKGISMVVETVGSSITGSNVTNSEASAINLSLASGNHSNTKIKALETSFSQDSEPSGEEVDRLRSETKMTRREIHGWFSDRKKKLAIERKKEEALQEAMEGVEVNGEDRQRDDSPGELKVNPIKINLKMLKVTEASSKAEGDGLDGSAVAPQAPQGATPSLSTPVPHKASHTPKPATVRGKKTLEQLELLKNVYVHTQWPSAAQYDELISGTGLARPEVVRWFGDCRYMQKNGQLKWLETYQNMALEQDLRKGNAQVLQAHWDLHGVLDDTQLQDLAEVSGLTTDLVRHWFSNQASTKRTEQTAATRVGGARQVSPETATGPQTAGSSPLEPQPGGGTEEKMEQSVCGVATGAEANANKTVNPVKETD